MVKLSRKGKSRRVRPRKSLKKRSSRRRMMKGGGYEEGITRYIRRGPLRSTLYELYIEKDDDSTTYTLDFSNAGMITTFGMNIKDINKIIDKYTNTLIDAFEIADNDYKKVIKNIITKLFEGGVAGAKKRTLMITEFKQNANIKLNVKENDAVILEGSFVKPAEEPKFENFLRSLGNDLVPIR